MNILKILLAEDVERLSYMYESGRVITLVKDYDHLYKIDWTCYIIYVLEKRTLHII